MMHENRQDRERWIASGMPDAVVTIMFRDGTLPPPSVARWYDSGLTTDEIADYRRTGRTAPDELGLPSGAGFAANWNGLEPTRILDAIDRGFVSASHFAPWADTDADASEVELLAAATHLDGFEPATAIKHLRSGKTPDEIVFSLESGVGHKKARKWIEAGMSSSQARAWTSVGFSASAASAWRSVTDDPDLARRLKDLGHDVESATAVRPEHGWSAWEIRRHLAARAGAADWDVDRWADASLPDDALAPWIAAGVDPDAAEAWHRFDVPAAEAANWAAQDFAPDDAAAWRSAGIDPRTAGRRRSAGVHPPSGSAS